MVLLGGIIVILLVSLFVMEGCTAAKTHSAEMPDVVGSSLEVAKSDIERAGYTGDVEVVGGGLFGIFDDANWEVCEQLPKAGAHFDGKPRLTVKRSCAVEDESSTTSEPKPSESTTTTPTPAPAPTTSTPAPSPAKADAKAIEQKYLEHLHNNFIESIPSMCDPSYTHWACFYDGVEGDESLFFVDLTTDGGWSDTALNQMADQAGRHWFNFIGCDFPALDPIVVNINGLHHNVFRSSTMVRC